jgi:hypothetical protein
LSELSYMRQAQYSNRWYLFFCRKGDLSRKIKYKGSQYNQKRYYKIFLLQKKAYIINGIGVISEFKIINAAFNDKDNVRLTEKTKSTR